MIKSFTSWLEESDVEFAVVLVSDNKHITIFVLLNHIDFHELTSELVVEDLLESAQTVSDNVEGLVVVAAGGYQVR